MYKQRHQLCRFIRLRNREHSCIVVILFWWDISPISAGLWGVPIGFAVIIIVSLLTKAPDQEVQDLVEYVRYPSLDGKTSGGSAAH